MRLTDGRTVTLADVQAVTLHLADGGSVRLADDEGLETLAELFGELVDEHTGDGTLDWSYQLAAENEPADRPVVLIGEPEALDGKW